MGHQPGTGWNSKLHAPIQEAFKATTATIPQALLVLIIARTNDSPGNAPVNLMRKRALFERSLCPPSSHCAASRRVVASTNLAKLGCRYSSWIEPAQIRILAETLLSMSDRYSADTGLKAEQSRPMTSLA